MLLLLQRCDHGTHFDYRDIVTVLLLLLLLMLGASLDHSLSVVNSSLFTDY